MTAHAERQEAKSGFTLLEVMLAMLLVGFVLVALMMAIDTQFRVVEATRSRVEEAQLARVVLHRIADDLRCLVPKASEEATTSSTDSSSTGSSNTGSSGSGSSGSGSSGSGPSGSGSSGSGPSGSGPSGSGSSGSGSSGSGSSNSGGSSRGTSGSSTNSSAKSSDSGSSDSGSSDSGTTSESEKASEAARQPGLSGGTNWLQIDICRLPRPDQWERLLAATEAGVPSGRLFGLKTVAYYLASEDQVPEVGRGLANQQQGGLVRQEAAWAAESDASTVEITDAPSISANQENIESLAPEVTELGFRYFDGSEWQDSWDSCESGTLPVAVEITLVLHPLNTAAKASSSSGNVDKEDDALVYRLVVDLPAGQIGSTSSDSETEKSEEDTDDSQEATQ